MVKDNGLHSQDPDYDDYGYSDFLSDYAPTDEQIGEWLENNSGLAIQEISTYVDGRGILDSVWNLHNQDEIEREWDADHEREPDEA